jgi:ABC-type multidrug transport system fused ATPase/permease subunit
MLSALGTSLFNRINKGMVKKLTELKALSLMRIASFRKGFLYEVLLSSKKWALMSFIFGVASIVFNLGAASLILPSLMRVFDSRQHFFLLERIDSFASRFVEINNNYYFLFFVFICFFIAVKSFFMLIREILGGKLVFQNAIFIKNRILRQMFLKDASFFIRNGSGFMVTVLENFVTNAAQAINSGISVLVNLIIIFFSLSLMFWVSPLLFSLVSIMSFPMVILFKKIKKEHVKSTEAWYASVTHLNQQHLNLINGIRFLKLANAGDREISQIMRKSRLPYLSLARFLSINFIFSQTNEIFGILCVLSLVCFSFLTSSKILGLELGFFFSFLTIFFRVVQSFNNLTFSMNLFSMQISCFKKIEKLLFDTDEMDTKWGSLGLSSLGESIQIQNVSFVYPQTQKSVLNSVNLTLPKGKHVAIVGPSGSGKSTIIDLVLGFYRPTNGVVKVNGKSYEEYKVKDYRKLFGLVSQDSNMFFPTVRENLTLFKPEASELEIRRALDQADALEFIDKLPDGIDTVIGERGVKLSGGQKQRISIARALLHDPQILIFDEATSSLDSLSEARIIESIKKASVGRTSITVAHRLSTVMHCDKIIFLENGWVMEEGTPHELMAKHSRFRKYAESQNLKMSG